MFSFNGIGTRLYGAIDSGPDGSYITTEWVIVLYIPIVPLNSYRVIKEDAANFLIASQAKYKTMKVPLHKKQVLRTYMITAAIVGVLALLMVIGMEAD